MRICLMSGIFPPDIGGPATYVSCLAQALHQQQHEVCVITLGDDAEAGYPFAVKRVSRAYPWPLRLVMIWLLVLRYGWTCDLWYINGLELPAVLAGKLLGKAMILKVVGDYAWERAMNAGLTRDDIEAFQHAPQHWKVEMHKRLRAWIARQMRCVITPSNYLKQVVCGWGVPDERLVVVYNAVEAFPDDLGTKEENRKKLDLPEDGVFLITVARLVPWKGIDQLIQILPNLDKRVHLLILGDGPQKNTLTDLAENLNVANRIRFPGKTNRRQVLSYLRAADVFVLNTAYEGFSHVLLEAMMVGLPVVTTAVCGNPELVSHRRNGILVPYNAPEMLTDQLALVIKDSALREKLVQGGAQTRQKFSWERLLKETLEVLTHCEY